MIIKFISDAKINYTAFISLFLSLSAISGFVALSVVSQNVTGNRGRLQIPVYSAETESLMNILDPGIIITGIGAFAVAVIGFIAIFVSGRASKPKRLGIVVSLAISLFTGLMGWYSLFTWRHPGEKPSKISSSWSIKANMHNLQTMVETYRIGHNGRYPPSLDILASDAKAKGYERDFVNPYTKQKGIGVQGSMIDYGLYQPQPEFKGLVLYKPFGDPKNGYHIYGTDQYGYLLQNKGTPFSLSAN